MVLRILVMCYIGVGLVMVLGVGGARVVDFFSMIWLMALNDIVFGISEWVAGEERVY